MRILFIGGTRFIGAHAARLLHDQGNEVTVFHRGKSENPLIADVQHIRDAAAEYPILHFPLEVTEQQWDAIVHMVAMGASDSRAFVDAFAGHVGRVVLISSGDVYRAYGRLIGSEPGLPDPAPLREDAPLRSRFYPYRGQEEKVGAVATHYEKIFAERAVMSLPVDAWTVLRLPKVYGPEENAGLSTVYGFASRPEWRWTHGHVDNVAAAIALASTHRRAAGRIYNVGEESTPTMGQRLERLPKRPGIAPPTSLMNFEQSIVYDTSHIRQELGYAEKIPEAQAMLDQASRSSIAIRI